MIPNGPAYRCCGSYYLMGQQIDAMDPTTEWANRKVPWILISHRPVDRWLGYYLIGRRIDAVDIPTVPNGPAIQRASG
jgi:hypothetical protein